MTLPRVTVLALILCLALTHHGLSHPISSAVENQISLEGLTATSESMSFDVTDDSWISSNTTDTNNGDDVDLWVGIFSYGVVKVERRILLRFDISNLPAGAIVESARLELWQTRADGAHDYQIWPYEITGDWEEAVVTWQNAPSYDSVGDPPISVDYEPGVYRVWDVTNIVQSWQAGTVNRGILLAGDGTTVGTRVFRSSESIFETGQLTITYHEPEFMFFLPFVRR